MVSQRVACRYLEKVSLFQEFVPRSVAPWFGISAEWSMLLNCLCDAILLASRALNGRSDRGASEKKRDEVRVGKWKLAPDLERLAPDARVALHRLEKPQL